MILNLKYDLKEVCNKIIEDQLSKLEVPFLMVKFGEIEIQGTIEAAKLKELHACLNNYGIEIVETQKSILVQKTKNAIIEMVYIDENLPVSKISTYLATKLKHSYGYISNLFSDITYTSIENFIIIQKIERAKELIATNELNFSEIAYRLNYSSVAHFSTQFKNTTGITPTAFKRIITKRRHIKNGLL